MSIHLVIDARMVNHSGIGVYIKHLVRGLLQAKKFTLTLIGNQNVLRREFGFTLSYQVIHTLTPIYSIQEQILLPSLIPDCDIFWSPHYNIPLLPIRARKRLVTIHDTYPLSTYSDFNLLKTTYVRLLIQGAVKLSEQILTVSEFSKTELCKLVSKASLKTTVIPNGVDNSVFQPAISPSTVNRVRSQLSLPDRYILFVGNVKPNKNLVRLVQAFSNLLLNDPTLHLVIVGKKDGFISGDKSTLRLVDSQEALRQRVIFTGYVHEADLPVLYKEAIVFAFPSLYEGFGLPPLEAMACGCSVLTSQTSSLPEVCGPAAVYIDPLNVKSIQLGLETLLYRPKIRLSLIEKGFVRARQFAWTESVRQLMCVIGRMSASTDKEAVH